jgi:hypothetical protein
MTYINFSYFFRPQPKSKPPMLPISSFSKWCHELAWPRYGHYSRRHCGLCPYLLQEHSTWFLCFSFSFPSVKAAPNSQNDTNAGHVYYILCFLYIFYIYIYIYTHTHITMTSCHTQNNFKFPNPLPSWLFIQHCSSSSPSSPCSTSIAKPRTFTSIFSLPET